MRYTVGIIGHFGGNENFCDGQTVKTKNLAQLLERQENIRVRRADTYCFRRNKGKLLWDTLRCMFTCRHIFLMVSSNGMRFYLPFLYYLNKLTRCSIYHYIIGSELLEMVRGSRGLVKYLNALGANWFEYDSGTRQLRELGVRNAATLTNFKLLTPVESTGAYRPADGVFRFCTFSRVMEEKGITDAAEAVARINAEQGRTVAALDIYGVVEPAYRGKLDALLAAHRDCVSYRGVVDSGRSVEVLKDYYALLFPTRWAGEGVPGTVIDAFAAGIPVIATDWNANGEIIRHGETGMLYPNAEASDLEQAIRWALDNRDAMDRMREKSRMEFVKYMPETILDTILKEMDKNEKRRG